MRDEAADAARKSGHAVDAVRDAGREAGISTRYLDHVLIERGLATPATRTRITPPSKWWAGAPVEIIERTEADGELDPSRFDSLFNLLRDGTGHVGSIIAGRKELGWRAEWFGSRLDVSVVPADGKTSISVVHRMRGLAGTTILAVDAIALALWPVISAVSFTILSWPTLRFVRRLGFSMYVPRGAREVIAIAIGAAVALAAIPIGRMLVRRFRRQHERKVLLLSEALTAKTQLAINEDDRR
jgi:hypothetical protein